MTGLQTQKCGLDDKIESLVQNLAQSAEMLGLDDPTEASLDLAIANLRQKAAMVPLESFLKKIQSEQNKRAILKDLKLSNKTDQALRMAQTESKLDEENIQNLQKKFYFMQEKEKEYVKMQEKYVAMIKKSGYNKSHANILALREKLDKILEEAKPIEEKLEAYKGLPASLELARAELATKEDNLHELKCTLQSEVQKIQI